ncbi:MAG: MarR family transcriptional regulator [Xanthobacteraceae bacterium]
MSERPRHQSLALLLHRVRVLVRGQFQEVFRRFDLSEQQWRIMSALNTHGEMSVTEIADRCLISRPSVVGIIQRMEMLDYICRTAHTNDKRKINISLSKKGGRLVAEAVPMMALAYKRIEVILGKSTYKNLFAILEEAAKRLEPHDVRPHLNSWDWDKL